MKVDKTNQIFVSTSGIRAQRIGDAVRQLANAGFNCIELSGGTKPYPELETDLLSLKSEFNLVYRCHNYFPPPDTNFVMNLSSSGETLTRTLQQVKYCLSLSRRLGADRLGVHAGFRMDPRVDELGQRISSRELIGYEEALARFQSNLSELEKVAVAEGVALYVENNVYSEANQHSFAGENPFLLTHFQEYKKIHKSSSFKLLLDVAHLKVSCHSLGLDFKTELTAMLAEADYVHISDNDGTKDSNGPFVKNSELYALLQQQSGLKEKTYTLEVYGELGGLIQSYQSLLDVVRS